MSKRVRSINIFLIITLVLSSMLLSGCGGKSSADVLNIYNVGDYIDEELLDKFTKETGIKIIYETYEIDALDFSSYVRVSHGVNKKLLLAIVDDDLDITYYNVEWTRP